MEKYLYLDFSNVIGNECYDYRNSIDSKWIMLQSLYESWLINQRIVTKE